MIYKSTRSQARRTITNQTTSNAASMSAVIKGMGGSQAMPYQIQLKSTAGHTNKLSKGTSSKTKHLNRNKLMTPGAASTAL